MTIREVALDRDVRSPRLVPPLTHILSIHFARRTLSVLTLLTVDVGAVLVAVLVASRTTPGATTLLWPGLSIVGLTTICAIVAASLAASGMYGRRHARLRAGKMLKAWSAAFVLTLVIMLAVNSDGLGARVVAVWLLAFVISFSLRWLFEAALAVRFGVDGDCPRALLLGPLSASAPALTALATLPPQSRLSIVGLLVPDGSSGPAADSPAGSPGVVGTPDDLQAALRRCHASEVILTDPLSLNGGLRRVMDTCRSSRVTLKVVAGDLQFDGQAVSYVPGLDCPLFVVSPRPAGRASYVIKQIADRVAALLLLIVLSPAFLAIAALIKLTSRGPVLFVSQRIGVDQRSFDFYKFRSMTVDAQDAQRELQKVNEADGILFKIRDDPRVTPVGRVLRRLSLDELPQLLNVLRGDMSLVGPRPLPLRDCEFMKEWHRRRHVVQPGITGLWQVSGRSDLGFEEMVTLDLRYIETWTLRTDLYILWHTAAAVVSSRGAY